MMFGCVALAIAGMTMCYSGNKITCSDIEMPGVETCKCQSNRVTLQMQEAKRLGICSPDGSTCGGGLPQVVMTCR